MNHRVLTPVERRGLLASLREARMAQARVDERLERSSLAEELLTEKPPNSLKAWIDSRKEVGLVIDPESVSKEFRDELERSLKEAHEGAVASLGDKTGRLKFPKQLNRCTGCGGPWDTFNDDCRICQSRKLMRRRSAEIRAQKQAKANPVVPSAQVSPRAPARLTNQQTHVLWLIANGWPNQNICQALGISPHTLKHHKRGAMLRLGVDSTIRAVVAALRANLFTFEQPDLRVGDIFYIPPDKSPEKPRILSVREHFILPTVPEFVPPKRGGDWPIY